MISKLQHYGRRLARWGHEVGCYVREAGSARQWARLMKIRLALSKVGRLVCPARCSRSVRLQSMGGPVLLRSHTSDISVLNELVVSNGYGPPARMLPVPETIVDLGANTGLAARWFLHRWPGARVVAVEPEPGNVEALRRNLEGFPAIVLPVAVGGCVRRANLHTTNGEFAYTLVGPDTGDSIDVQVVTMADIVRDGDIDRIELLKVDIEGAERELFADCADWIDRVDAMIVECHDGYTAADLLADCKRGGSSFELLDLDLKPEWAFEVATVVRA